MMTPREFAGLFPEFRAPSWAAWSSIEDALFGRPPRDPDLVRRLTGRTTLPTSQVSELWAIVGRGGGKSRFAARLACFFACAREYRRVAGESIFVAVIAPDKAQAAVTFRYVLGLLHSVPSLERLIVSETKESVALSNGIVIEVITASMAAPRGRAYALVIVEEAAFLPNDTSAEPDRELLRAVRPALARVPGSLLAVISSPYAMEGELFNVWSARFGHDDADVLVLQADTATLNPSFSAREIERAFRDDPVAAEAEYGAQFRRDVSSLLLTEAIMAVVPVGVRELAPDRHNASTAHLDFATGIGEDAAGFSIAKAVRPALLQVVRHWAPPFDPSAVCAEVASLCKRYEAELTIDRFAPGLVIDLLRRHGVEARVADQDTSMAFVGLLALINSRGCRLLDNDVLIRELRGLERRTATGGKDRIGHGARGHDDLAAAVAFALTAAAHEGDQVPFGLVDTSLLDDDDDNASLDDEPGDVSTADEDAAVEPVAGGPGLVDQVVEAATSLMARVGGRFSDLSRRGQGAVETMRSALGAPARLVDSVLPIDETDARQRARRKRRERDEAQQIADQEADKRAVSKEIDRRMKRGGGAIFPHDDW